MRAVGVEAVLCCGLLAACGASKAPPSPTTSVELLACNPVTGTLSFSGPALRDAMQLAADEISGDGGINGRPLSLIHCDTHSDPQAAIAEASFLYRRHPAAIAVLGGSRASVSKALLTDLAANALTYGARIPIVSPATTSAEFVGLLDATFNLFSRTVCSSQLQGTVLADKARAQGFRRGLVVGLDDTNNRSIFDAFRNRFLSFGSEYRVTVTYYTLASPAPIAESLASAFADDSDEGPNSPDFLLLLAYGDDGRIALNEWARKYSNTPLMLSDSLFSKSFFAALDPTTISALDRGSINGVLPWIPPTRSESGHFVQAFCGRYPRHCGCQDAACLAEARPALYTSNAYDAVYVVALALQSLSITAPGALDKTGAAWSTRGFMNALLKVSNQDAGDEHIARPGQWAQAAEHLKTGGQVDYFGANERNLELDSNGDPTNCGFSFWTFIEGQGVLRNSEGEREVIEVRL